MPRAAPRHPCRRLIHPCGLIASATVVLALSGCATTPALEDAAATCADYGFKAGSSDFIRCEAIRNQNRLIGEDPDRAGPSNGAEPFTASDLDAIRAVGRPVVAR